MMEEIQLSLNENKNSAFYILEDGERLGEMVFSIEGRNLTVYHTDVSPKGEGKGLAKKLLTAMVDYAKANHLSVIPLCPFVHAQFQRHPDLYNDVWSK